MASKLTIKRRLHQEQKLHEQDAQFSVTKLNTIGQEVCYALNEVANEICFASKRITETTRIQLSYRFKVQRKDDTIIYIIVVIVIISEVPR